MRLKLILGSALVVLLLTVGRMPAEAVQSDQGNQVFRIGAFDRSSAEFAVGTPTRPVTFVVGRSTPAKDWYAVQPAENTLPGSAQAPNDTGAPRVVNFSLDRLPAAGYEILVSLLIENPTVPALKISVNGKKGTFYLHPKLDYKMGDQLSWFDPIYSQAEVRFAFPGSYLHEGMNSITFQVLAQADEQATTAHLIYDAVELDRIDGGFHPEAPSTQILPTIFFRRNSADADQLNELIDVFVRYGEPVEAGTGFDLVLAGRQYHQALRGGQDFGEEKLEFSVPEFPAQTQAQADWDVQGHRQHSEKLIDPEKKWKLYVVPHIHIDVGYTDYQAKVATIQSRVIDEAMDLTAKHPDFRFSLDGGWPLSQFMAMRVPEEQKRAITAIKKEQLFVPAQYASLLTGFPTAETLIRSFYPSADFSRVNGTPFNYANITDVPSYTWSYASILASAGLKYFLAGSDNSRAPVFNVKAPLNESSPFWWQGPDGKKVLLWYSRHYMQVQYLFGLPALLSSGRDTLPLFLQQYERPAYRANAAIIFGTEVENTDLFPQQAELVERWNNAYAYPRLQYSGVYEALKSIGDQLGDDIPTIRGDGGPYWENGIASDAYYAAMERENESRGPSAEKLATLSALVNPRVAADTVNLDRMWTDMVLMDEHTWTSHLSVSDPKSIEAIEQSTVKNSYASTAHSIADWVTRSSMTSIVDSIYASPRSLVIFNTLNWKRSGRVCIDLNSLDDLIDLSSAQAVPVERVSDDGDPKLLGELQRPGTTLRGKLQRACFVAQNVPATGYKVFSLRHMEKEPVSPSPLGTTTLESPYYRVKLDSATGSVRSIYDKQLQRELVSQDSPYRFGQYLYVTGGDGPPNRLTYFPLEVPKAPVQVHPAAGGVLLSVTRTPSGEVARMQSSAMDTPRITTEIRLFDQQKKIEFTEDITKKEVDSKEAVYFAFPFALNKPQFQYEIQNGVVDPAKDMYLGAGYEWFSVQHWVSAQQNGVSATVMPLDAGLVTLGDIVRGAAPTQFGDRPGTIFSYPMNNYWFTNWPAGQGGNFRFRYIITSAPSTDPANLSRIGWEEMTPLEPDEVTTQDRASKSPRPLDGKQESFLDVEDPNLLLETWKPAEDGNGTILRFLDFGGTTRTVTVQTPLVHLKQVWQTDAVERNELPLSLAGTDRFQFTVHPNEIVTVRIFGEHVLEAPAI
jgi:alpha-mannosidase